MSAPDFDVSALTQKIQRDIKSRNDPRKAAKRKGGERKPGKETQLLHEPKVKPKQDFQGKKRTRDGNEKSDGAAQKGTTAKGSQQDHPLKTGRPERHSEAQTSFRKPPASAKSSKDNRKDPPTNVGRPERHFQTRDAPKSTKSKANDRNTGKPVPSGIDLRQIIGELGGDDEDLKLIEDVGSESELEGDANGDQPTLKKDIQRMVKELGLAQASAHDADTSEAEGEEEADHQEEEGYSDEESNDDIEEEQGEDENDDEDSSELIAKAKQALEKLPTQKKPNVSGLIIEPQSEWHTIPLPSITASKNASDMTPAAITDLHEYAKKLLQEENDRYAKSNTSSSSANQFYSTIMSSGTLSDKISALTLSVQESPLHNMRTMENLVNMAKKRSRGQAVDTLSALKDLLGPGNLLPTERRLRTFALQPALRFVNGKDLAKKDLEDSLPQPLTKTHLVIWAYEDWLKSLYFDILKVLEVWCNDEIPYTRQKSVGYIFELLRDKPEQEANLLRLLVNKLGDTDKKIASKASYYVLQIQNNHPAMKPLIIEAIKSDLIFRRHQSSHAKYYGVITLNQSVLSSKEEAVAHQLLDIYFDLFMLLLKKPTEETAKPVLKTVTKLNSKGEVQGGGSLPGKRAQKKAAADAQSTTVEEELSEKMLSAVLTGVNRAMPFVDKTSEFFDKHLDTLFRVTHSANFNTSVQALMLIQQLCGSHQAASDRFYRTLYESLLDPRILTSSKQALYLNLLYRALRADLNVKRIKAFVKRMLQTTAMHQASFACAVMYLVRELEELFPGLAAFIDQPEADDDDDEEAFNDVPEDGQAQTKPATSKPGVVQSNIHRYDGRKRDPEHAAAEASCLWELSPLQNHFHPSVSLFANSLINHQALSTKPDLNTNTLIQFLDRFVYRNPKKTTTGLKGQSIMQPLAAGDSSGLIVSGRSTGNMGKAPLNTEGFRIKSTKDVAPDEVFFHRYFNELGKKGEKAKKKKQEKRQKGEEEEEEEAQDEVEDEIWQALVDSRPEVEGEDDEDDDLDLDDLEDEMDGVEIGEELEEAEDDGDATSGAMSDDDDLSEGAFDFDEEDAIFDSDEELPAATGALIGAPIAEEEGDRKKSNKRRKMLKSLPMFASADDYAKMLEDEEEE